MHWPIQLRIPFHFKLNPRITYEFWTLHLIKNPFCIHNFMLQESAFLALIEFSTIPFQLNWPFNPDMANNSSTTFFDFNLFISPGNIQKLQSSGHINIDTIWWTLNDICVYKSKNIMLSFWAFELWLMAARTLQFSVTIFKYCNSIDTHPIHT